VTVSIVIVNYRSWEHLERCLGALAPTASSSAEGDSALEIVVVDNDSGDARLTEFAARHPQVRFHANSGNHGFAHGCNAGAARARGELLLFLNPDVIADRARVARLVRIKQAHPEVAILTARQIDGRGRPQKAFDAFPRPWTALSPMRAVLRLVRPRRYPDPRRRRDGLVYCDWVSGSLLLIAAADLRRLGGFCEDYWMYMEDVDLCTRAWQQGLRVAYTGDVEFVHLHGGASRRDGETTAVTKSETIVSKHVYIARHFSGTRAALFHLMIALKSLPGLVLAAAADALTFGAVPLLRARSRMLRTLIRYYARAARGGGWLSHRSPNFART